MINFHQNKIFYISPVIVMLYFFILFFINMQNYNLETIFLSDSFYLSSSIFNLGIVFIVFPTLIFVLLQMILNRYLSFLWASTISALSIFSYAGYDFKQFVYDIFFNFGEFKNLEPKKMVIFEYPNISISILIFLFLTWLCLVLKRFQLPHIILITILWSFFSTISFSGSVIGILFWTIFSILRLFRLKRSSNFILTISFFNLIFYLLFIYLFKNIISIDGYNVDNIYNYSSNYFIFYFVAPILSILLIYYFYKIDLYEIFIKFTPIYVLMILDFIISICLSIYKSDYQNHEFFIYPHFVLHFLYIVPIIYYLNKPLSPFENNKKTKINICKKYIFIFFGRACKLYLPLIIILLLIFSVMPSKIFI